MLSEVYLFHDKKLGSLPEPDKQTNSSVWIWRFTLSSTLQYDENNFKTL